MLRKRMVLGALMLAATMAAGEGVPEDPGAALPKGLERYLEARVLEANGRFREAMEAYAGAVKEAPDVKAFSSMSEWPNGPSMSSKAQQTPVRRVFEYAPWR
jgi:hypothetical protein